MLGIGDTVTLTLPGVTFSGNTITSTTQYEPLADTPTSMSASFSVSWDSSSYELTFTATAENDRNTSVVFDVVGAILPKEGFPVHRNYLQDGAFTNSSVTIRATSTNGNIAATELDEVTTVGFASDSTFVHYIIKDPRTSVGVRLQFKLSEPLAASDVITFYSPFLVAPSAWGNTETALAVLGDRGDKDLIENFDVTFNPVTSEIKCTATAAEAAREINLYIEENNGLFIRFPEGGVLNGTHWATAAISGAWTSTRRTVDYTPTNVAGILIPDGGVDMSNPGNCAYDEACSLRFMLTLKADMQANEAIAITHPHLTRITNFTNLYIGNTTATTPG